MFEPLFWVQALWLMLPAYIANMAPVVLAKVVPRWKAPIDGGRTRADGTRILGDGKTWRGLIGGAVVAAGVALLQSRAPWGLVTDFGAARYGAFLGPLVLGAALGAGALIGDAVKSYFKRMSGRPRGAPWIGPDQLDFVIGGFIICALAGIVLDLATGQALGDGWVQTWLVARWWLPLTVLVATPLLHWLVNVIGYKLGLKQVPW